MIEILVVLAIVAILALMAVPSLFPIKARAQIIESIELAEKLQPGIEAIYVISHKFPRDNKQANLPEPEHLIGNFVETITLKDGALHLELGNKIIKPLEGQTLSILPITVVDSPESPISWVCGYSGIPEGMQAMGENKTSIKREFLPINCR